MTGATIRAKRTELGWSQDDLARRVGVKPLQVSRWERGEVRNFRLETAARVAAALGLALDDLNVGNPLKPVAPVATTLEQAVADLHEAHRQTKGRGPRWARLVQAIRRTAGNRARAKNR
jgi:transcriptional regulator with XRE-family HTH domain